MNDGDSTTEQLLRSLAIQRRGGITAGLERIRARPDLVDAVLRSQTDESDEVRAMALIALLGVTAPGIAPVARKGLVDRSPQVRALAVRILGGLGPETLDEVTGAVKDPDPRVVLEAIKALSAVRPVPELIRGLLGSPDATQRQAGVKLVGQRLAVELSDEIVNALRDPDPRVRAEAVNTLVRLGPPALERLAPALRDGDGEVREAALRALAACEDAAVDVATLRPLLADPAAGVRALAVGVFQRTAARSCVDVLPLLQDPEHAVRAAAMACVAAWRCEKAVPELERFATAAADKRDRAQAINALIEFGQLSGSLLIGLLADPDVHVRVLTARAARGTTDPTVRAALGQAMLSDPSANVRRTAAQGGTETGSDLVPILGQAIRNDPEPGVRLAAIRAIARFPAASAVGVDALGDADPRIRAAAVRWLGTLGAHAAALIRMSQIEDDEEVRAELSQALSGLDEAAFPASGSPC